MLLKFSKNAASPERCCGLVCRIHNTRVANNSSAETVYPFSWLGISIQATHKCSIFRCSVVASKKLCIERIPGDRRWDKSCHICERDFFSFFFGGGGALVVGGGGAFFLGIPLFEEEADDNDDDADDDDDDDAKTAADPNAADDAPFAALSFVDLDCFACCLMTSLLVIRNVAEGTRNLFETPADESEGGHFLSCLLSAYARSPSTSSSAATAAAAAATSAAATEAVAAAL
mmetsp:Transcript_14812/g.26633  ORF Transcript_14812/g.26633 Transcript_14812/m.26633 type:complete len:231 (+) Transcript_14812:287-979(+)